MGGTLVVMPSFTETIGALALAIPLGGTGALDPAPLPTEPVSAAHTNAPETNVAPGQRAYPAASWPSPLDSLNVVARQSRTQGQIRIEQRVYVRIAPRSAGARRNLLAQLPVRQQAQRYEEKKTAKCVPVSRIAGVETGSGNRLLLFLRDAKILSVNLEKACRARDFYAGFYVERNKDGKLCVDRDTLQSRNGARCDIARMMQLKAIKD